MACMYCQGQMERGTAPFHIDCKGYHLILDTVPAWVCVQCGEAYLEEAAVEAMQPFSTGGVYVNYLGQEADEGAERVQAVYGPTKYARLVALKNKYDPTNFFRLNQNIKPTV